MTPAAPPAVPAATPQLMPAVALIWREVIRFCRQRSRLIGAVLQPAIFWVLFGAGLSGSFRMAGDQSYQTYFLPGITAMIVMFTSIFSAISVIQDRHEGFLQGVLASPASRWSIVAGKLGGGSLLAVLQGLFFLLLAAAVAAAGLAPATGLPTSPLAWLGAIGMLSLIALELCGLGYGFAWKLDSVQGFHSIMSVLLFPMWLLSGAFFPVAEHGWLSWLMRMNPLTYGVAGLRHMLVTDPAALEKLPSLGLCVAVSAVFAVGCAAVDVWLTSRSAAAI